MKSKMLNILSLLWKQSPGGTPVTGIEEVAGFFFFSKYTYSGVPLYPPLFWPTFLPGFVDIFVWVKSGPESSHEPPHVDRNKIYYLEFPGG